MSPPNPRAQTRDRLLIPLYRLGTIGFVIAVGGSLASCVALQEGVDPSPDLARDSNPAFAVPPTRAKGRIARDWWTVYKDPALDDDVETALSNSPGIAVLAHRLEQSDAQVKTARAATWPRLNLGLGYRPGRARDIDFGPYDLAPWQGTSQFQWELDLWGKLRHSLQSARSERNAAHYDLEAAKLILISRIAEARFRLYRLREEKQLLGESVTANGEILELLRGQEGAGIVSNTDLLRAEGEHEKLKRSLLELERLEQLALAGLRTLRGRSGTIDPGGSFPSPPPPPGKSFTILLQSHPDLLAEESRVRSAFQLEESTRLNLLPSLQLNASAMGRSPGFLLDEFRQWQATFGPSLDLPVFDPARLAALDQKKAATREASARYREALFQILEDIEASHLNWANRHRQLATVERELDALELARKNVRATFKAGLVSQIEVLEIERSTLAAARARAVLRQAILNDHLSLLRALGGGVAADS